MLEEGLPVRGPAERVRRTDTIAQTYREGLLCPALSTGFEDAQRHGAGPLGSVMIRKA